MPRLSSSHLIRVADLSGTFVFAVQGALAGAAAGLDPVGVLVLAFVTALGGGIIRDVLIGALPPAAIRDWHYGLTVVGAAVVAVALRRPILAISTDLVIMLDAAGLSLAAVAGTRKALDHGVHPFVGVFLGAASGAGGGTIRDVLLNEVPRVLRTDVYASAAALAALLIVAGDRLGLPPRAVAAAAGIACFAVRVLAVRNGWHLPMPR